MHWKTRLIAAVALASAWTATSPAEGLRLVRALSGPSGRVEGSKFAFDVLRNRFVHPQDKSFVVYFEWEAEPGLHTLTASLRSPAGQVEMISPDVKVNSQSSELTCYWTYMLHADAVPGVWTVEVKVDGRPAGSHALEIAGTSPPNAVEEQKSVTLDEVFRAVSPSLVRIRKIDAAGKRTEASLGFVLRTDRVLTAFQAIDGSTALEIEFDGSRKVETRQISAWSRAGDWAIVEASTAHLPALALGDPEAVKVGERLALFNVDNGTRALGGVDVTGRRVVQGFGTRLYFAPSVSAEAAGGPLLNKQGKVVGILGGSVVPGSRFDGRNMSVSPKLGIATYALNAATPVTAIPSRLAEKSTSLAELTATGALTPELAHMEGLLYVATAAEMTKSAGEPLPRDVCEFSRRDKQVWVLSEWIQRGKVSKGFLSGSVYDEQNRLRVKVEPKKTSLSRDMLRTGFGFVPEALEPGTYRVDVLWDGQPVWRTFIRITD